MRLTLMGSSELRRTRETPPLTMKGWLRWDVVRRLLPPDARTVLDIGAGAGSIGSFLADRYEYVGIEPDPMSYARAQSRVGERGQLFNCGFEAFEWGQQFDLVCAFEVLEHLEDDAGALVSWLRHVRPGGSLLVSVPHGRERLGPVDARVGHLRRYDVDDLTGLLEDAGLRCSAALVYGAPWGHFHEAVENVAFRVRPRREPLAERTAVSGRVHEPPPWAAGLARVAAVPLQRLQRPLSARRIGTGLVALGTLDER